MLRVALICLESASSSWYPERSANRPFWIQSAGRLLTRRPSCLSVQPGYLRLWRGKRVEGGYEVSMPGYSTVDLD